MEHPRLQADGSQSIDQVEAGRIGTVIHSEIELIGVDDTSQRQEEPVEAQEESIVKECSIHLDVIGNDDLGHRGLTLGCAANHKIENEIICTGCLKQHLYGQMFPLYNEKVRHRFPSTTVKCWASDCFEVLDHHVIQQYADADAFRLYDQALYQRYLEDDPSLIKCASPDCAGAGWNSKVTKDERNILCCPLCSCSTCGCCKGPYEMHLGRPCPAEPRSPAKIRLEETKSKVRLSMKNKCPKCPLRYEKMSGCDHITCGGGYAFSSIYGKSPQT